MSLVVCGAKKGYDLAQDYKFYKANGHYPARRMPSRDEKVKEFVSMLIHLSAGVMAAYIAWSRNEGNGVVIQSLVSVLAFMFGIFYLVYVTAETLLSSDKKREAYLDAIAYEADETQEGAPGQTGGLLDDSFGSLMGSGSLYGGGKRRKSKKSKKNSRKSRLSRLSGEGGEDGEDGEDDVEGGGRIGRGLSSFAHGVTSAF